MSVDRRQDALQPDDVARQPEVIDPRYDRQMRYRRVGAEGQRRLGSSRVVVVGVGATGGVIAETLARAGVGRLSLIDRDYPELVNLQRQTLYSEADVATGDPKAIASARRLREVASTVQIDPVVAELHAGNARHLLHGADVIVDGTDNFAARYVINDTALLLGRPWVYCGAVGAHGAAMAIGPGGRPCLRCLYPEPPDPSSVETCDTVGVLGPAVSAAGAHAAMLAMRWLLGDAPESHLVHLDVWHGSHDVFGVPARDDCPGCGKRELPALAAPAGDALLATTLCGRESVHLRPPETRLDLEGLASRLAGSADVLLANEHLVRARTHGEPSLQLTVFADGRAIVSGTDDVAVARALYGQLVGPRGSSEGGGNR